MSCYVCGDGVVIYRDRDMTSVLGALDLRFWPISHESRDVQKAVGYTRIVLKAGLEIKVMESSYSD